ncbi:MULTISPECIES: hypothetical protein [unclassified Leeuwenhoekiella]|uniref:hypothetical protein n=1 Tax=unclassified Leeuwenhoekiella TaxID=2615029 RepID=UPI000C6766C4|nr:MULTISPECIES: hypothetical protein [unclassified Leeuwenhoekiella]MAW94117.1 hypothetical protein [Leeuwenhoekiella sp.]MBA82414.1 hypothetical protein [Leeuwenhoekiella sp.]|tara:strand:+ start:16554 stop:16817 length:264 start_codon:yes stop_codon:yes gene_type:complete
MRLSEKDRKFLKTWEQKRNSKFQYALGIVLQILLFAITYKVALSYVTTAMFGPDDLIQFGLLGLILGLVIAFLKYKRNEKRYQKLNP